MTLKVQAGKTTPADLQTWLCGDKLKDYLTVINNNTQVHALAEYVHRFEFVDHAGLFEDINKKEVDKYCIKGRIFWEHGQIEWRKLDGDLISLLILIEDGACNVLPDNFTSAETLDTNGLKPNDRNLILWGSYKDDPDSPGYYELRVEGSREIEYPSSIRGCKDCYPVLHIREYVNAEGDVEFWRFVRPDAMNESELVYKR